MLDRLCRDRSTPLAPATTRKLPGGRRMTTDPFDALREPVAPLAPRPAFAEQLRRRIVAELGPDREDTAMPTKLEIREYTPARLHSLTPYLACDDPAAAIAWYIEVFDAHLLGDPIVMPDGRIGHAELRVGDTVFMLAGEFPEENHRSPRARRQHRRADAARSRRRRDHARSRAGAQALRPVRSTRRAAARSRPSATAGSSRRISSRRLPVEDARPPVGDVGYDPAGARRRGHARSTLHCSTGRCTRAAKGSTSRRSRRRRASRAGTTSPTSRSTSASTTSRRPRNGCATSAEKCSRPRATSQAATPSASTTKASGSTSSAPAPATDKPRTGVRGRGGACGWRCHGRSCRPAPA